MKDSDKIKMFLNIGGQQLSVTVPAARQEFIRRVETGISELYNKWRKQFPARTDHEILAMVAYQYANYYAQLSDQMEEASRQAEECLELALRDNQNDHSFTSQGDVDKQPTE